MTPTFASRYGTMRPSKKANSGSGVVVVMSLFSSVHFKVHFDADPHAGLLSYRIGMNSRSTSPPDWTERSSSPDPESVALLLADWAAGPGSLTARLAGALRKAIDREEIAPGSRLPSERALAEAVAVSRTTIVAAYELLRQ